MILGQRLETSSSQSQRSLGGFTHILKSCFWPQPDLGRSQARC